MKPYEDEQLNFQPLPNSYPIERIPMLVDPATGQITHEFQSFYDELVCGITHSEVEHLYRISDKSCRESEFNQRYMKSIGDDLKKISENSDTWMMDIQLNMDRFQNKFRTVLGSFYITVIQTTKTSNDLIVIDKLSLYTGETEIFFTYLNGEFCLIPIFNPIQFNQL